MRQLRTKFLRFGFAFLSLSLAADAKDIHHYVFFELERERISDTSFLATKQFEGAQLKYTWRELEPEPDQYAFEIIQNDLEFLTSRGKKLFIQLQDVTFDTAYNCTARYLLKDEKYHGGANMQFDYPGDNESLAVPAGWVTRRWDPTVQARFHKLLIALGKEFDGKIEGVNLPETSVTFGETGKLYPIGFNPTVYRDAIITNMKVLKEAFPKSITIQYANFMPGEWLPWTDSSFLKSVYVFASKNKIGVGGPDLLPFKKGQMNHSYKLISELDGTIPIVMAVQWGNYEHVIQETGKQIEISELIDFAANYLKVDYLFWCTQEPYYSEKLKPLLKAQY